MGHLRIGIVGYTNFSSGIGLFDYELWKYLEADSILSINAGIKGQEIWTDRQTTAGRPQSIRSMLNYFENFRPDVVMFLETPFAIELYDIARQHNCMTVAIPMHETFTSARLDADLLICPSCSAYEKAYKNKIGLFLPIGLELFPFKLRTGHTFVCNIGYGGPHDRRQSIAVVQAFHQLCNPDARLILNTQAQNWPREIIEVASQDSRIILHRGTKPQPKDIYSEGDIAINIMAYGGYERPVLESMASGMPCLTMDADPMNLFQHDPDFLMPSNKPYFIKATDWVVNTWYNQVDVNELTEKMEWLLTIDTEKYSKWARAQAEAQSWESKSYDFRGIWLDTLEELCL